MKKLKNQKAITLVALVITIIILLILAGIAISIFTENNIVERAKEAKEETMQKQAIELMNIKIMNLRIARFADDEEEYNLQRLADELCEDEDVEYVLLHSNNIGSLEKITVPEGSSIFVKMKAYPYEFEINNSLNLIRIDGVEIEKASTDNNIVQLGNLFDKYIYIDANNGNDSTGDGTSQKPYKTLAKITESGIIENNFSYGIILKNGTYILTDSIFNMSTCNKSINIIGNRQNTILSVTRIGTTSKWTGNTDYSVNFYRLVWDGNNRSDANTICIKNAITLNQIVLKNIGNTTYGYFISSRDTYYNNCTLMGTPSGFISYWHASRILTNCYGDFTVGESGNHSFATTTCYITNNPYVNENTYQITESNESIWKNAGTGTNLDGTVANIGVYGGTYSWEFRDDIF